MNKMIIQVTVALVLRIVEAIQSSWHPRTPYINLLYDPALFSPTVQPKAAHEAAGWEHYRVVFEAITQLQYKK